MRKEKFDSIEEKLSKLLLKLGDENYLKIICANENLKKYDDILAKINNGDYSVNYLDKITDEELDAILDYLKKVNE